jgi:hypothetical protein
MVSSMPGEGAAGTVEYEAAWFLVTILALQGFKLRLLGRLARSQSLHKVRYLCPSLGTVRN